ncbi:kinase binding protein CGI-121-domain-containing protein [Pyrenochaeta sp. MPI-SDFR-AT-0127]|nr:kinase binding protein CGI-121-domain-containing protein [Pyrenochaeta sp. MPI-SDFR-AT-0127]
MASIRTFTLPHYHAYPVHVALFKDVTNAAYLRTQLLEANPDFDYAFLDASMILSPQHLLSATFLALHSFLTSRQKTRTPHSELVFRLSPNNNIGESYKKFGLTDSTSSLIAVKLSITAEGAVAESVSRESVSRHLGHVVQGTSVEIGEAGDELGAWCDLDKLRKMYKLSGDAGKKVKRGVIVNGAAPARDERKEMESVVLGIIALKGS